MKLSGSRCLVVGGARRLGPRARPRPGGERRRRLRLVARAGRRRDAGSWKSSRAPARPPPRRSPATCAPAGGRRTRRRGRRRARRPRRARLRRERAVRAPSPPGDRRGRAGTRRWTRSPRGSSSPPARRTTSSPHGARARRGARRRRRRHRLLGLQPWAAFAAHGAAKAAQIHLVKELARAWADDGVRVCGVAPGPVDLEDDEHRAATLRAGSRGGAERLVTPAQVAAAVRHCIENDDVTGVNLVVDAGGSLLTARQPPPAGRGGSALARRPCPSWTGRSARAP